MNVCKHFRVVCNITLVFHTDFKCNYGILGCRLKTRNNEEPVLSSYYAYSLFTMRSSEDRLQFQATSLLKSIVSGFFLQCIHTQNQTGKLYIFLPWILYLPNICTKWLGEQAFSCAGPKLWYSLPLSIQTTLPVPSFKKVLKTFLGFFLLFSFF